MSYFDTVYSKLKDNFENEVNCIPSKFNRFKPYFIGIIRSTLTLVVANSGVGKSRFTKWAYIFEPFRYVKEHPELNIKLKIFYFSLEENKDKFVRTIISSELYKRFDIIVSPRELLDLDKDNSKMSSYILDYILACKEYVDELLTVVEVVDWIKHPYGVANHVREYARANGRFYFKGVEIDYVSNPKAVYDEYRPNNPDEYVLVITDPINLLTHDTTCDDKSKGGAMNKFSSDYCLTMRDKLGYTVVNVQQLAAATEQQEYTYKGQSIEAKLEPSLSALGDSKLTARDCDYVYGLFAPDRYELAEHRGYNIKLLQDNYRQLSLLKDRDGEPNARIGLYFQGAVNEFTELPPAIGFRTGLNDYNDYIN